MIRIVLIVLAVLVVGGAVVLATWDIPAPTEHKEIVIPNDRFQK